MESGTLSVRMSEGRARGGESLMATRRLAVDALMMCIIISAAAAAARPRPQRGYRALDA